jgi:hypothetical protein
MRWLFLKLTQEAYQRLKNRSSDIASTRIYVFGKMSGFMNKYATPRL